MLFNSYSYIFIFLPVVWFTFFRLARIRHTCAVAWLALSSILFYGYWNPAFVWLLLLSIAFNYFLGRLISKADTQKDEKRKKRLLLTAITVNLLVLIYFKYAKFFLTNVNWIFNHFISIDGILLPLGISFFTFTQITFLVDTYNGRAKEYNFIHYLLFVTFFPHLIAGPVLHHRDMMPQFSSGTTYRINWTHVATGLTLFTLGLCKKVLLADSFSPVVTLIFDGNGHGIPNESIPSMYEAWLGAVAYSLQIYFDFSGYTDMALGSALMFNIHLPTNFNSPYKSTSIIDFWRRWHITLSVFLKDYLYIPLGGNRFGDSRRYINLMITMLLGGLWHGAGWTFVIWGAMHGCYLICNHLWRAVVPKRYFRLIPNWMGALVGGALTFAAVVTAWVVFRSNDLTQAVCLLKAMFGIGFQPISFEDIKQGKFLHLPGVQTIDLICLLILGLLWVWLLPNSSSVRFVDRNRVLTLLQSLLVLGLLAFSIDQFGRYSPFLYFQF